MRSGGPDIVSGDYGGGPDLVSDIDGDVLSLRLNRPESRNALTMAMLEELVDRLRSVRLGEVRIVKLTGTGSTFCAGSDLKEDVPAPRRVTAFRELFEAMDSCPSPIVAQVNGSAFGGGVGVVAASDHVVASAEAVFALSEPRFGTVASLAMLPCLRRIGFAHASDLFLTGRTISSAEAVSMSLVNSAADENSVDALVRGYCDEVRRGGPLAIRETRALLRELSDLRSGAAYDRAGEIALAVGDSAEFAEGRAAFRERRAPNWQPPSE